MSWIASLWSWLRRQPSKPEPPPIKEERTSLKGEELTPFEVQYFEELRCPDCGEQKLMKGPEGGLSINVYCGNEDCRSMFNVMGILGIERISAASPAKKQPRPEGMAYR